MNIQQALSAIEKGSTVDCSKEDYQKEIRTAIQKQAGKWIDGGDHIRAIIALEEVKRLDKLYPAEIIDVNIKHTGMDHGTF